MCVTANKTATLIQYSVVYLSGFAILDRYLFILRRSGSECVLNFYRCRQIRFKIGIAQRSPMKTLTAQLQFSNGTLLPINPETKLPECIPTNASVKKWLYRS